MNKRLITGLIVLMGIAILGIIGIQLIWMRNAISVNRVMFDRNVNEALWATVEQLENDQDLQIMDNFLFGGFDITMQTHGHVNKLGNPQISLEVISDSLMKEVGITMQRFEEDLDSVFKQNMTITEKIVFEGKDHVVDASGNQVTIKSSSVIVAPNKDPEEKMMELHQKIQRRTRKLERNTQKMAQELFQMELGRPINPEQVEEVFRNQLTNRGIDLDFEFALVANNQVKYCNAVEGPEALAKDCYQVNLFPHDIIPKQNLLAVNFPGKGNFILSSIGWLLIVSLVFSLIVLVSFAFSVMFLLRQKKVSEMKSDFINNMTHEFKTPIATITVASDSLFNSKVTGDPDKIKYFAGMIRKENKRMNQQVEKILRIARFENKKPELNFEIVDLHEQIEKVATGFSLQVEEKKGTLTQKLDASNAKVMTDRTHIANVISNLLDNANKYSPEKPQIIIETTNTSHGVIMSVTDHGIGMSRSVQNKIFDKFYRETSGNIHNVKGFGLGLSYVKAIISANMGEIKVRSEVGKGSRFEIFLPFTI
ncbi:HAMP domain-containing histidine kinase [Puteibacter caeruleilacunae]|nr:HAMP domain-containing histidine kinase [Puteibacter caeruleilacunae]